MKKLMALWQGDLALRNAFWDWAVFGGIVVNVPTSILCLVLLTYNQSWAALLVGYGFSVPYNFVAVVGVWRSAARHDGPVIQADLARIASVILLSVLSLT